MGGGDAAKWIYRKTRETRPDLPIIGMVAESNWLEGQPGVVDIVRPADVRDVVRKLSKHGITELAVFGKALSSVGWRDLTKNTETLLKATRSVRLDLSLPNAFFSTIQARLGLNGVTFFSLGSIIPELVQQPGSKLGKGEIAGFDQKYDRAVSLMNSRREDWWKQGIILFPDREPCLEVSGTKTMIRTCVKKGWDLEGAILVKAEVKSFEHIDIPVIDSILLNLCYENGMTGIIADAASIVIDIEGVTKLLASRNFCVYFV